MAALFTTEEDGVTVTKHVETEGETVKIGFRIVSSSEQSLTIRILDAIPATATVKTLTADASRWSTSEGRVTYERMLESEEALTTSYAFTCEEVEADVIQQPVTLRVTETAANEDGVEATYTEDAQPAAAEEEEEEAFAMPDDEVSVTEMVTDAPTDGTEYTAKSRAVAETGPASEASHRHAATQDDDVASLIDTVLETLDVDASAAQRERLAEEFAAVVGPRSSLEFRLMHLQSQFQDLAAYIDAMEAFLDDHGTAEDVLTDVLNELHVVREQLESVRDEQATLDARLEDTEGRIEQLESAHESRADAVDSELRQFEAALEDIETTQQTVQQQLKQVEEFRKAFQETFQDL